MPSRSVRRRSPPITRPLLRLACLGLAYGGLGYGVPIAVLHIALNGFRSVRPAAVLGAELLLLYGLAGLLLVTAVGTPVLLAIRALRARQDEEEPRPYLRYRTTWSGWPLRVGLFAFGVLFWVPYFLWGLTYEQTWIVAPRSGIGMATYLGGAALVIALGVGALSWVLDGAVRLLEEQRRVVKTLAGLAVLGVVAIVVTPLLKPSAPASTVVPGVRPGGGGTEGPRLAARDGIKVVLVGFDGLDPEVVDRLVAEGKLPTFERLRRDGVYGPLQTVPDANSALLWASIYTGMPASDHGVHDFYRIHLPGLGRGIYPVHRTFFKEAVGPLGRLGLASRVAITRGDLAAPPLWEIANWAGLSIGVVDGYLYSFPALQPRAAGGYFLANGLDGFTGALAAGQASGDDLELYVQPASVLADTELPHGADFEWQSRALLDLLRARPQPQLVSFYCHEPDTVQHQHWRSFEPWRYLGAARDPAAARDGGPVAEMYRRFDEFLAELLETLEPGTALFVVSDHGHAPTILHSMDTQHRHGPPGVFLFHGGPIREGYRYTPRATHIYDVMPTVLYLLGLPVPRDAPGRVLDEALDVDLVRERPVRYVASYRRLVPAPALAGTRDERANEAEIEKLRRLGYVW